MKLRHLPIAALAAGCAAPPSAAPLPSATAVQLPKSPSPVAMTNARPCRYDYRFYTVLTASSGLQLVPGHDQARITYDAAGLDVLEEAIDDQGAFAFRATFEYDAMGHLRHDTKARADSPGQLEHDWLVYDSFGRLIRQSRDLDGDGREDWVTTYGYAGTGNPVTAHVAYPQGAGSGYDRAYRYDDDARLIEVDRYDRPDGVVAQLIRYAYDDARRVTTMTTADGGGAIVDRSTTTYDDHNRVLSVVATELDPQGNVTATATDSFTYDAERLVSEAYDDTGLVGSAVRYDWQYDHCQ